MLTDVHHPRFQESLGRARVYSPEILPQLQSLLADLADIDFVHERRIEAIERGPGDESLKRARITQLRRDHQEHRAPYVAALEELQEQIKGCFD